MDFLSGPTPDSLRRPVPLPCAPHQPVDRLKGSTSQARRVRQVPNLCTAARGARLAFPLRFTAVASEEVPPTGRTAACSQGGCQSDLEHTLGHTTPLLKPSCTKLPFQ